MTNEKKITNKGALQYVLDNCEIPTDVRAKIEILLHQQENKSRGSGKPTATQTENARLIEVIADTLPKGEAFTISDITKTIPELNGFTPQKVGPMLKKLVETGRATRDTNKGKAYYTMV